MGLFKPAWQSKNIVKALDAIKRLNDQSILLEIQNTDGHGLRGEAARNRRIELIGMLNNQSTLVHYAKNDNDPAIRRAAVNQLIDQSIITEIAKNDCDDSVCRDAVLKITNQAVLADIAINTNNDKDIDGYIRMAAIENINDKSVLANIAKNTNNIHVQMEALAHEMIDIDIVVEFVKQTDIDYDNLPMALFRKLYEHNNQSLFTDIATNARNSSIRKEAAAVVITPDVKLNIPADAMPLNCPKCNTIIKLVSSSNMSVVYENYDKTNSGYCPFCGYKYRE